MHSPLLYGIINAENKQRAIEGTGWARQLTPEGKAYYYHKESRQTTWAVPEDVQRKIDQAQANMPPQRPPAGPAGWAAGPSQVPPANDFRRPERDEYRPDRRDREREPEAEPGRDAERRDRVRADVDDNGDPAEAEEEEEKRSERLCREAQT